MMSPTRRESLLCELMFFALSSRLFLKHKDYRIRCAPILGSTLPGFKEYARVFGSSPYFTIDRYLVEFLQKYEIDYEDLGKGPSINLTPDSVKM